MPSDFTTVSPADYRTSDLASVPEAANASRSLWILGSPRSGTTYLQEVLNRHPDIFLTNETRVMVWVSHAICRLPRGRNRLYSFKGEFLAHFMAHVPALIEDFYRSLAGKSMRYWGDKYGNYADGEVDPECLGVISQLFPNSRFIHIVRDGASVVTSLVKKGWAEFDEAKDLWRRHVVWARKFGDTLARERFLEVRYDELTHAGESVGRRICDFLGLEYHEDMRRFLEAQRSSPTPFSKPITEEARIGRADAWREHATQEQVQQLEQLMEEVPLDGSEHLARMRETGEVGDGSAFNPLSFPRQWRHIVFVNDTDKSVQVRMGFERAGVELMKTGTRTIEAGETFEWGVQWFDGVAILYGTFGGLRLDRLGTLPVTAMGLREFVRVSEWLRFAAG